MRLIHAFTHDQFGSPSPWTPYAARAGAEYDILRELVVSGVLCRRVDYLFMEWHRKTKLTNSSPIPYGIDESLTWMLASPECGVTTIPLAEGVSARHST